MVLKNVFGIFSNVINWLYDQNYSSFKIWFRIL